jgi:hypothetical protein
MLGQKAKDKITGFEGVVTGMVLNLYDNDDYGLQAPLSDKGEIPEAKWFDAGRLEFLGRGV